MFVSKNFEALNELGHIELLCPLSSALDYASSRLEEKKAVTSSSFTPPVSPESSDLSVKKTAESKLINHLSNTLAILDLMSESGGDRELLTNISAIRSSCNDVLSSFKLESNEPPAEKPFVNFDYTPSPHSILLICDDPMQKIILKKMLINWGYSVQLLSHLPKDADVLSELNLDLILLAENQKRFDTKALMKLDETDQSCLLMSATMFPALRGRLKMKEMQKPFSQDLLKYEIAKMFSKQKKAG